jgi:MFS transporter, SP family, general alpha glucoside:H+ symporter
MAIMKVTQAASREQTEGATFLECFKGTNLRRTIITIMPLTIQAMSGVAYISSYGTYYFQLAGISTQNSFQIQCGAQALSIAGNIGAFLIIDRVGRRALLLWAFGFLTVLLCVTGGLGTMTTNPSAVLGKSSQLLRRCMITNFLSSHYRPHRYL